MRQTFNLPPNYTLNPKTHGTNLDAKVNISTQSLNSKYKFVWIFVYENVWNFDLLVSIINKYIYTHIYTHCKTIAKH